MPLIHMEGFEQPPILAQETPVPTVHQEMSFGEEISSRAGEIGEGLLFPAVGIVFTGMDLILHQLIPPIAGDRMPPYYYRNKIIFGIPALVGSRIASDFIGGSRFV